jgi:hypothetical protein
MVNPSNSDLVTVYVKGAPEILIEMCPFILKSTGSEELQNDEKDQIIN